MRVLVTGASGFIGRHVIAAATDDGHEVIAAVRGAALSGAGQEAGPAGSVSASSSDFAPGVAIAPGLDLANAPGVAVASGLDLADAPGLEALVAAARPDAVIHLAGFANVGWSHREPATAITVNTAGSAALLTAVAAQAPDARVVLASTSEVYARSAAPLREGDPTAPESPYGQSKLWMEEAAAYFRERHRLSIGVVRSFAHCGPGQGPAFAVSNFARQLAEARLAGRSVCEVTTGNKATVRDLSDVRDAARAYLLMAASDQHGPLNVGSGQGRTTAEVVATLAAAAGIEVDHREDPALVRPGENPSIVADVGAAASALGWEPQHAFADTAAATVDWWASALARDASQGTGVYG